MFAKNFWEGKKILITGGAGFIGSTLARNLLNLNCEVRIADNLSRGKIENIKEILDKVQFSKVDLTDIKNCISLSENVDYVFHLAAAVGGIHFIKRENVGGLTPSALMNINMMEAARINDIDRFLFASSACVYRERSSELNMFREEEGYPAYPHTTYGWAKILGEILCKAYYTDYGIKSSAIRIFNAYGENEEFNPKWSHVIPSFIRKTMLFPKEEFKIFGDGKQERAFLHVQDCVDGLLLGMQKIENADSINLGSEEVVSISDLAKKIIGLSRKNIEVRYDLSGPRGTNRYCADTTKMKEILEWKPNINLNEGLRRTFDWAGEKIQWN
jgi:GDP-D-mannose 3',5'-epimerase